MTKYTFPKVTRTARKTGFCSRCGGRVVRSKTFEATVNPFNRNELGAVKGYAEVSNDIAQMAADWVPNFDHDRCPAVLRSEVA